MRQYPYLWQMACFVFVVLLCQARADADGPLLQDDFSRDRGRYEFRGEHAWRFDAGTLRVGAERSDSFAVANVSKLEQGRIEADLCVERRLSGGYVTAGLTLFADAENHWRLLLVASPEDRPYFELIESLRGIHQAQTGAINPSMRLAARQEGELTGWQYGRTYRLSLSISPESIVGEIRDPESGRFWRNAYSLDSGRALRSGRPGLAASGVGAAFDELAVHGRLRAALATPALARGPAGSVVIIPGEDGGLAEHLKWRFEDARFGATVVPWEEAARARFAADAPDLVVLADARRLPARVAGSIDDFLHARGKVIAVGAPAFGHLLLEGPSGYVTADQFGEAVYAVLEKRPLPLQADGWSRASDTPDSPGCVRREPAPKEPVANGISLTDMWKLSLSLDGWDNFFQPLPEGFGKEQRLLCFLARGDADTPQMSIECVEQDHSRWIATVELSGDWRAHVLQPRDFVYWYDSRATGRGGPGDRLVPGKVARIHFGLSRSHTPRCERGPHTVWLADVATAAEAEFAEREITVPDIGGMSPSHQIYPLENVMHLRPAHPLAADPLHGFARGGDIPFSEEWYSPVWRENGIGFGRHRRWRWVRVLDAYDRAQRNRGSLVWMGVGENVLPGAIWANLGLADPAALLGPEPSAKSLSQNLARRRGQAHFAPKTPQNEPVPDGFGTGSKALNQSLIALAHAMTHGCFLLEGGSRSFSYHAGEPVELGAMVLNAGREKASLRVVWKVADRTKNVVFEEWLPLVLPPAERREVQCRWTPASENAGEFPYTVTVELREGPGGDTQGELLDRIEHKLDRLSDEPARLEDFVRVEGSQFILGGKPWFMLGVNYRPTSQGGRPTLDMLRPEWYDPEIIERDLAWLESIGVNTLSAIFAPTPADPNEKGAYRDLHDFLQRCRNHGIKVFYFLPWADPVLNADAEAIQRHIEAAGVKDDPAILAWELAWEPIHSPFSTSRSLAMFTRAWNDWIVERYGSLAHAERDWEFELPRAPRGGEAAEGAAWAAVPSGAQLQTHGPWDRVCAAFRRFYSDHVGQAYGRVIRQLRRFDPNHLVTFRFGACGIPDGARFAHAHSASVAKHVSFLCPEGYNLQTEGWGKPTPADEIRKGGLVTLYYRFLSREKPVVWMEFGYTVNGIHGEWKTGREKIDPQQLANQQAEYENFYRMFLESGARGAAPWWLPGGFRLGEASDFGILNPDGSERPACEVVRRSHREFSRIGDLAWMPPMPGKDHDSNRPTIALNFDAHFADAWQTYAPRYLAAIEAGTLPSLKTAGSGTTSADCPLVAVGGTPLTGHNPPAHLNAEFNSVEVRTSSDGPWREIQSGELVELGPGETLRCRASIGNIAEATWLAPRPGPSIEPGKVYLECRAGDKTVRVPIAESTPYLGDAVVREFVVPQVAKGGEIVSLRMFVLRSGEGEMLDIVFGQSSSIRL